MCHNQAKTVSAVKTNLFQNNNTNSSNFRMFCWFLNSDRQSLGWSQFHIVLHQIQYSCIDYQLAAVIYYTNYEIEDKPVMATHTTAAI